jgi:hypothetical protein
MKLREATVGSITPLFLLLAVVLNSGAWALKSRELRGDYGDHARTVAIALAEHLRGADAESLAAHRVSPRVAQALTALERWGLIAQLQVWDAGGRSGWRWPADTALLPTRGEGREDWVGDFDAAAGTWRAGALLRGRDGTLQGWIEVEVDAADYLAEQAGLKWTFLYHTLVVLLGAWILAGGLAWLLARDLRRVSDQLRRVGAREVGRPDDMKVGELADLAESFVVLDAILREHQTKESSEEYLVSEGEVALAWRCEHDQGTSAAAGNWWVELGRRQTVLPQEWRGYALSGNRGAVWFGRLHPRGPWRDACRSAAAESDIKPMAFAPRSDLAATWTSLARCYEWESGVLARWEGEVPRVEILAWHDGESRWREESGDGGRWLVHNLPTRIAASARHINAAGAHEDEGEVMTALSAIFGSYAGQMALLIHTGGPKH